MSEELRQAADAAEVRSAEPVDAAASVAAPANKAHPQGEARGPRDQKRGKKRRPQGPADRRPAIGLPGGTPRERREPRDQGRRDVDPSRRAARRDTMIAFKPIATHPAAPANLELRTEYTQRLFIDHYGRAQISLYNLMQLLPIRMRMNGGGGVSNEQGEKLLDALEALVDKRIDAVKRKIKLELGRAKRIADDNGVEQVTVYSNPPKPVSMAQLTPQIIDMLGLLPVFDDFIGYIDGLYLRRLISRGEREKAINGYRNEVVTLIRYMMHLYHESKRLLDKGEVKDIAALLSKTPDEASLRERLDDDDEAAARVHTGESPAPEAAAA